MIKASIIITGNEVLNGKTEEKNFRWLSQRLNSLGIEVKKCVIVGDDPLDIENALKEMEGVVDAVIVTGGLGPTSDDITAEVAARFLNKKLVFNESAFEVIKKFWERMGRPLPEKAKKQAFLPEGVNIIENPIGSACGFFVKQKNTLFIFLPGVPREVKSMFESVIEILKREFDIKPIKKEVCIVTFGIVESKLMEELKDFDVLFPEIRLGYRIKFPEVLLYLTNLGEDVEVLNRAMDWIKERLADKVVSVEGESLPVVIGRLLKRGGYTLAVAESCTGGLIGHLITNVPGSSDYFLLSCVTYSNEAKMKVLGVKEETLKRYGAVHEKTAEEMALGVKKIANSDFSLATTGIAGPTGGSKEKPVGTICIAVCTPSSLKSYRYTFNFNERLLHKRIFAYTALDLLRKSL